jgi:ABC-type Na+ efflux pump permease subunit
MRSSLPLTIGLATIFALFHIVVVAIPVLSSGGSGETQAFTAAVFDLPIFWLLGLFPAGRGVLYGGSQSTYILVFSVGGTLMYAVLGALIGRGLHSVIRVFHAT